MPQTTDDILKAIESDSLQVTSLMLSSLIEDHMLGEGQRIKDLWKRYRRKDVPIYSHKVANYTKVNEAQAIFDSRVFNIPKEEVCNYFIWRQLDWFRNSLQMLARTHFSHKELNEKNTSDIHEMLHQKGVNWADLEPVWKNGVFIWLKEDRRLETRSDIIFTKIRYAIERYMEPIED